MAIKDMQGFTKQYPGVTSYFPIEKEVEKLPRQYIANVIYTVVGQPFAVWVKSQMEKRNDKIKAEQDMLIDMDPEIAEIFKSSQSVSGKSLYMLVSTISLSL